MRLCLHGHNFFKNFRNPAVGSSVVFGPCGSVYASAIERTSKSRYKVYVISSYGVVGGVLCYGIGEALKFLQGYYH